jgi:hypothetical protein
MSNPVKKLSLNREIVRNLTANEIGLARGGKAHTYFTEVDCAIFEAASKEVGSDPCGKFEAAVDWWNHGGGKWVSQALCLDKAPLSGGVLTMLQTHCGC